MKSHSALYCHPRKRRCFAESKSQFLEIKTFLWSVVRLFSLVPIGTGPTGISFYTEVFALISFPIGATEMKNTQKRTSAALQSRLCAATLWLQVVLSLHSGFPGNAETLNGGFDWTNCLSDHDERRLSRLNIKEGRRCRHCSPLSEPFRRLKKVYKPKNKEYSRLLWLW